MKRALLAIAVACVACHSKYDGMPKGADSPGIVVRPLDDPPPVLPDLPKLPAVANSHLVGTIERKAIGPFTARTADGGIIAWIRTAKIGGGAELVVVPTGVDGSALKDAKVVTQVPEEATALFVRPAGGIHGGWLVAYSALLDRGESLTVVGLAPDGSQRGVPFDVQRTSDHIPWADLVPSKRGSTCVWAEEMASGGANILAVPVDPYGKAQGVPVRVASGVTGWATARAGDGVGLALVAPTANDPSGAGTLTWMRLDAEGRPAAAPVTITARPTVSGDVDVAAVPGGWLLAWTDRTGEDAQVMLATVDAAGRVRGPRRAMNAVGGTALAGLAAGPAGVALAWQEPRGRRREMRALHLASVSLEGDLSAQPMTALDLAAQPAPELAATDHGFAVLAMAHACLTAEGGAPCDGPKMPTAIRLDARLSPVQAEPLYVGTERKQASIGWALRCAGDACVALAATGDSPTPIYAMELGPRQSPYASPAVPPPPVDAPRVTGVTTIASGLPYAQVDAANVAGGTLVATLTTAVDTIPEGQKKVRHGGLVHVRAFDGQGTATGASTLLTSRALPVGGVAIAAGGTPEDGAVVAWVARDSGDPQVHLSHVDRDGKKLGELQLTTTKGDAFDVAVAWAGDGWLVAWVDSRDGNGEVYASKVDRDLKRTAREERITKAAGDAGDVSLAVKGDVAWLAWSDPRESPRDGVSDIYVTTLRTRDAKKAGSDVRVLATAAHSRSPAIVPAGDGAVVAWIEDSPSGLDAPGAAMAARLDAGAHVVGMPGSFRAAGRGRPTEIALEAAGDAIHAIVARTEGDDVTLDAVALRPDGTAGHAWPLLDLDAPASFDVALALAGDGLYFDDVGGAIADHRVRRAGLSWSR